ncbi:MAG TPA: hypothetical protein PKM73_20665 [Verrucomicrobiota bacterium]|nr:hypothetical protein [Verrucomicrobiota bacterium]HNU53218.1 hypothetical protein [Verrucomicrobiota bacterium]
MNGICRVCLVAGAAVALTAAPVGAQDQVLVRELASREHAVHVGGVEATPTRELASRELSISIENGAGDFAQAISREVDVAVDRDGAPPAIPQLVLTVSPTGDSTALDWSSYNQWAVGDIVRFNIYLSDGGPFADVGGMTPLRSVGGGTIGVTLDGLTPYCDHYFAVVAVDAMGNMNPLVTYSAAYVLGGELVSREFSLSSGAEPEPPYRGVVSREYDLAVVTPEAPPAITSLAASASPLGDTATLDWGGYNQWAVGDIVRFEVYLSDDGPIEDVGGMTPLVTVGAGATSVVLQGLVQNSDHYFAVVPVDALGNRETQVDYAAGYVISPQAASREFSLFVGQEPESPYCHMVARETSIVLPDAAVPAPVTGEGSGFFVTTSTSAYGAVDLDWTSYNELEQGDVVEYVIYVGDSYFDNVTGLTPFATVRTGRQQHTLAGLVGNGVYHFAVVAVDALGGFDSTVRSYSAQASISGLGEATNLAVVSGLDSLRFTWEAPPDAGTFLRGYRIYFAGSVTPVPLDATAISWTAAGLQPATGYPFRIATVDPFDDESSGVSVLAATILPNPQNVVLALDHNQQVVMRWDLVHPEVLVSFYALYRSATSFSDVTGMTPFATTSFPSAMLGDPAAVAYQYFAVVTVNISDGWNPKVSPVEARPIIQGTIRLADGQPAVGVPLRAGGDASAVTGADGHYQLTLPTFPWSGTVAASQHGSSFSPIYRSYNAIVGDCVDQDFSQSPGITLVGSLTADGTTVQMEWSSAEGDTYQLQSSEDLVHWADYGEPIPGVFGLQWLHVPVGDPPKRFFRLRTDD